jgi:acid phosphatase class B
MKTSSILTCSSMILGCTLALLPTVTLAQFANSDNRDPFNRAATGDTSGLMQLLNKAQMSGSRNESEYYRGQDEQINSATEDFRARQIQALRQKNKSAVQPAPIQKINQ